jgi:hypothetical protein
MISEVVLLPGQPRVIVIIYGTPMLDHSILVDTRPKFAPWRHKELHFPSKEGVIVERSATLWRQSP